MSLRLRRTGVRLACRLDRTPGSLLRYRFPRRATSSLGYFGSFARRGRGPLGQSAVRNFA
jgi:hypothetical protein